MPSMKSPVIRCSINCSILKLPTAVIIIDSRIILNEIAVMTTAVVRLFLARLDSAMETALNLLRAACRFFFLPAALPCRPASVYLTASIGEILPAIFAGLRLLKKTVKNENAALNTKIHGLNRREASAPL